MSERTIVDYRLSEADNRRIFKEKIVPDLLDDIPSQENPQLTVVVAQHGAGKTQLANRVIIPALDSQGGAVDIDSDVYKRYHPAYDELMSDGDINMAQATGLDGQRWMRQALQYARDNRKHTLVQETVQNPPFLVDMIETYRAGGFRVEMTALGVTEAVSRQSILSRYYDQINTNGAGRIPPSEKIEASLNGVLDFAGIIDRRRVADYVQVVRRDTLAQTYHNSLTDYGEWVKKTSFPSGDRG